jgi:hypothetical protein
VEPEHVWCEAAQVRVKVISGYIKGCLSGSTSWQPFAALMPEKIVGRITGYWEVSRQTSTGVAIPGSEILECSTPWPSLLCSSVTITELTCDGRVPSHVWDKLGFRQFIGHAIRTENTWGRVNLTLMKALGNNMGAVYDEYCVILGEFHAHSAMRAV